MRTCWPSSIVSWSYVHSWEATTARPARTRPRGCGRRWMGCRSSTRSPRGPTPKSAAWFSERPGRAGSGDRDRGSPLASVPRRIRASDLHAWVGPSEMVLFLYGTGLEDLGQFVARMSDDGTADDRPLSAGIVTLRPQARARGESRPTGRAAQLQVLTRVVAARRALDQARAAGGGVRVAASP